MAPKGDDDKEDGEDGEGGKSKGVVRRDFMDIYSERERFELAKVDEHHKPHPEKNYYRLVFEGGSKELGIEFDHAGVVNTIVAGSQAAKMKRMTRGDVLDAVGPISVRGMTFREMQPIIRAAQHKMVEQLDEDGWPIDGAELYAAPFVLTFEEHMDWERTGSGLPYVDFKKLDRLFNKHDPGGIGSLSAEELTMLWIDVHDRARKARGQTKLGHLDEAAEERPFDAREFAQQLIYAHDDDNSERLERSEIVNWVAKEADMSEGERAVIAMRGGYCKADVQFIEDCAYGLALHCRSRKQIMANRMQRAERRAMVAMKMGIEAGESMAGDVKILG